MNRVDLIAPNVDDNAIIQKIGCIRPMRDGSFRIAYEQIEKKHLFHCYGFGGAGWVMLPGAIQELIRIYNHHTELKDKNVRVVGGGCMGLMAALMLHNQNVPIKVSAKSYEHLTSHNAGGLWAIVSMQTGKEQAEYVKHIGCEAYKLWLQSLHDKINLLHGCARSMPYYVGKNTNSGLDVLIQAGLIPAPKEVEIHFDTGAIRKMFEYQTLFIDTFGTMQKLMQKCTAAQVQMEVEEIHAWENVTEEVIFNCSGGLEAPTNDPAMIPELGHLCLTNNARLNEMQYMIFTHMDMPDHNQSGILYWTPKEILLDDHKCSGVFGGSFFNGIRDASAHQEEFENIKARTKAFFLNA